ncbi:MAG TPA: glycosyltransferase [Segetibacter sp.]
MNPNYPLVSVQAISYNQRHLVVATLDSIKNQTYPNLQLIIADDGSTDGTKEVIKEWINKNWPDAIFVDNPVNRGITRNLNTGLPFIKGEYVKQIGCDDVLPPDSISKIMEVFVTLPEDFGVVYTDMNRIDETGKLIDNIGIIEKRGHPVYSGYVYSEMIRKPFITAASMVYRRAVLDKLKKYNEKVLYEDHDFYLRASKYFKFQYIPEKLADYRVHSQSLINSSSRIKYFHNTYYVYLTNYDNEPPFKEIFKERLFFCIKNFYNLKFKKNYWYSLQAFFKTGDFNFLKYAVGSLQYVLKGSSL